MIYYKAEGYKVVQWTQSEDSARFYELVETCADDEIEEGWDHCWYLKGHVPQKPIPSNKEIEKLRIEYRRKNLDDKTMERMRKTANKTWTNEDEQKYLKLDAEVTEYILKNYPYSTEEDKK